MNIGRKLPLAHCLIIFSIILIFSCSKEDEPVSSDCFGWVFTPVVVDTFYSESFYSRDTAVKFDVHFHIAERCEQFLEFSVISEPLSKKISVKTLKDECNECDSRNVQVKKELNLGFLNAGIYILSFNYDTPDHITKKIIVQ